MTETVSDISDQALRLRAKAQDGPGNINIVPFAFASEVVDFAGTPPAQSSINSPAVIAHMDPVPHLPTITINRYRDISQDVRDEERY
jgi:hypothetical protein